MRHATIVPIAAASLLMVALAVPGLAHPGHGKAPETQPPVTWIVPKGSDSASVSFAMNKWLDDQGTQKAAVTGSFQKVGVSLNKPVSKLTNLSELHDLKAMAVVVLSSVSTGNPARDMNVAHTYFEAPTDGLMGPNAIASIRLDRFRPVGMPANQLQTAQEADLAVDGSIELHGVKRPLTDTQWHVAKRSDGIHVRTRAPITIASADFGLPAAALLKVCNHLGIDPAATVTASLLLKP